MPLERHQRLLDGQSSVSRRVLSVWAILGCGVALCILLRCLLCCSSVEGFGCGVLTVFVGGPYADVEFSGS
jgi:hypothetical protein